MNVSIRSYLAAGIAAATASAIVASPIQPTPALVTAAHSFTLSAAVQPLIAPIQSAAAALGAASETAQPRAAATASATAAPTFPVWTPPSINGQSIGNAIINIYNAVEPWFQWGWEVVAWAASWVVGALAQQINIIYDAVEPSIGAVVYSFAYLLDGEFSLIGPTLINGLQTSVNNLIQGEIAWVLSFFPPLPPIGSALAAAASPAAAATALAATAVEATPEATGHFARGASTNSLPADTETAATADEAPADEAPADEATADEATPAAPAGTDLAGAVPPAVTNEAQSPASQDGTPDPDSAGPGAVSGPDSAEATSADAAPRSTTTGSRAPHRATGSSGKSIGTPAAKSARTDRAAARRH